MPFKETLTHMHTWPRLYGLEYVFVIGLLGMGSGAVIAAENESKQLPETKYTTTKVGDEAERLLLELTNNYRRQQKLPELQGNTALTQACQQHAQTMLRTGVFSHNAGGTTHTERATEAGYNWSFLAENIYFRQGYLENSSRDLAEATLKSWQTSAGHNQNLLSPMSTDCGIAVLVSDERKRVYVVMLYGKGK